MPDEIDYSNTFLTDMKAFETSAPRGHYGPPYDEKLNYRPDKIKIENITIKKVNISNVKFSDVVFRNCMFIDCEFTNLNFIEATFYKCTFQNVHFRNTYMTLTCINGNKFMNSFLYNVDLSGAGLINTDFINTSMEHSLFEGCNKVRFHDCYINTCIFGSYMEYEENFEMNLDQCKIYNTSFHNINLNISVFKNCLLFTLSFLNCEINEQTIDRINYTRDTHDCLVDFQTIIRSDIPSDVLRKYFGIHGYGIKEYVTEMVSKMELNTVFISYSVKDKEFAQMINEALRSNGVLTFLWAENAPGGMRLKKIMAESINEFDKILFIASCNSLKSEACHFELSEARKKYEKTWDVILFPIHIDDYLFKVEQYDIPRRMRDLFYDNILELREIHSKDFSRFNSPQYNQKEFQNAVEALVKDLRKDKKGGKNKIR